MIRENQSKNPPIQLRTQQSEELKRQVDEYLQQGGKITVIGEEEKAKRFHEWRVAYKDNGIKQKATKDKTKTTYRGWIDD